MLGPKICADLPYGQGIKRTCIPARIPLSKIECSYKRTNISQHLNHWLFAHQEPEKKPRPIKNDVPKPHILRQYRPPPRQTPHNNLPYLTTEAYKRISPEFLKLLESHGERHPKIPEKMPIKAIRPEPRVPYNLSPANHLQPGLAKYLQSVLKSGGLNEIYNIDYCHNVDPADLLTSPVDYLDPFEIAYLLGIVKNGGFLSPEQMQFLINFLMTAAHLSPEKLGNLFKMLFDRGQLNPAVLQFLRNLFQFVSQYLDPTLRDRLLKVFDEIARLNFQYRLSQHPELDDSESATNDDPWNNNVPLSLSDEDYWNSSRLMSRSRWSERSKTSDKQRNRKSSRLNINREPGLGWQGSRYNEDSFSVLGTRTGLPFHFQNVLETAPKYSPSSKQRIGFNFDTHDPSIPVQYHKPKDLLVKPNPSMANFRTLASRAQLLRQSRIAADLTPHVKNMDYYYAESHKKLPKKKSAGKQLKPKRSILKRTTVYH